MSRATIERLVAAWQRRDAAGAAALFCQGATYREAGRPALAGREAILEHFERFFTSGAAWRFVVDDLIVEGDRGAVAYRFFLVDPQGKQRERTGCALVACEDGRICRWHEYEG